MVAAFDFTNGWVRPLKLQLVSKKGLCFYVYEPSWSLSMSGCWENFSVKGEDFSSVKKAARRTMNKSQSTRATVFGWTFVQNLSGWSFDVYLVPTFEYHWNLNVEPIEYQRFSENDRNQFRIQENCIELVFHQEEVSGVVKNQEVNASIMWTMASLSSRQESKELSVEVTKTRPFTSSGFQQTQFSR